MTKKFEESVLEEQARKQNGCEAETQGEAADRQEAKTASKPTEDATVTLFRGDGEGGVPRILLKRIHLVDVINK